jgi:hypothetical protein
MHLVQILLPVADNDGARFPASQFAALRQELTDRFGGVTVFARSPAQGFWEDREEMSRDDIVIIEVMCDTLDDDWWRTRRSALEREFRQEVIVIRAQEIRLL